MLNSDIEIRICQFTIELQREEREREQERKYVFFYSVVFWEYRKMNQNTTEAFSPLIYKLRRKFYSKKLMTSS